MSSIPVRSMAGWSRGLEGVHLHRGNGVEVALEQWQKLGCPKRPLFFVDGDHAYESVRDELNRDLFGHTGCKRAGA